jgi:methylamine---glutamate N-methyltransferase subunit A
MCGIVGIFAKNPAIEPHLGKYVSSMLVEMTDRGPDSAGMAVYRNPVPDGATKLSLLAAEADYPWTSLAADLGEALGGTADIKANGRHALVIAPGTAGDAGAWLAAHHPGIVVVAAGNVIEVFKEKGLPADVVEHFDLRAVQGSHALGHTRMATESAVTTAHSHPFSAGGDLCLVHNGSLSNHNRLREELRRQGVAIHTDNDTEVAAAYLTHQLASGASIGEALESALEDLDGFYTFAVGTRDGFSVLRDPFACKHAVLAETDDWVAMATEYRAIAHLPGAETAEIWEPEPATVYTWDRGQK